MSAEAKLRYEKRVPSGAGDDLPLPMAIVLHGRGADALDLADLAEPIEAQVRTPIRFLFPNAPRPWEAYPGMTFGFSWFDGWPPQGSSFADSRSAMLRFIDEALEKFPTPAGKLILCGFSQGALMSLDVGFRTTQQVAGIVAMSGAIHEAELPDLRARPEQRVIIVHGVFDEVIPVNAARRTRALLEEHGLQPEYHEFPMGHQVSLESLTAVADFMRRALD